jgi:hypothetical protein
VPEDCRDSRGGLFTANSSVMWEYQGLYDINTTNLGNSEAEYGLDTIGLGFVAGAQDGPTLSGQNVAGVTSVSPFYMYVQAVTCSD